MQHEAGWRDNMRDRKNFKDIRLQPKRNPFVNQVDIDPDYGGAVYRGDNPFCKRIRPDIFDKR